MTDDAELRRALDAFGTLPAPVRGLERRPSEYRTSHPLEILDVSLEDGSRRELVLKHVSRDALDPEARRAKPEFLYHPLREIETYRRVLESAALGTARCYGADPERGWLFLEKLPGVELWQVGDRETWEDVARWAARMHTRFAADVDALAADVHLLRYEPAFFRRWLERARELAPDRARSVLDRIEPRYDEVAEALGSMRPTFIHGELYASNVIVEPTAGRVSPVDWELAAAGPGPVDLAALTAGGWSEEDRRAIASAYLAEADVGDEPGFWRTLDLCRLHLAVQWLGWSRDWTPPEEHRQDWVREATEAADGLGW